ncbi:unnamed protein product [marine sediment metagenome]|uniref:Uncharacterized protein n=1 Tax=marine sediment metagenome TaxID=412755 RepID=X1IGU0_9ZZZZ
MPFVATWHKVNSSHYIRPPKVQATICMEIRPRVGSWNPFLAAVPLSEEGYLLELRVGPKGRIPTSFSVMHGSGKTDEYFIRNMSNEVTPSTSAYVMLKEKPTELIVGEESLQYSINV